MTTQPPLLERYPLQRIRVARQGRASTICLPWNEYMSLLSLTPRKSQRALSSLFREEVERLEQDGRVVGLSRRAREGVRRRLATLKIAVQ